MGYLDNIFENKAIRRRPDKPVSTDSVSRAVVGGQNTWGRSIGSNKDKWDVDKAVNTAYERVIWVFRCVDAISSSQASIPMNMKEYDAEFGHKIPDKQLNKLLNHKPNKFESSWTFRYRLSAQLLLSTKGAFIEVVRSGSDDIQELYLLDPGTVEPVKDTKKWVSGYKVKRADGQTDILDSEQVIWVRIKPHPTDPYMQLTPIVPASLSVETDYLARMFNRNFLRNDGRPGMLIGIKGDMSTEDGEELRALFSGGYSTAGQTRVIEADSISVTDLASKPRDVQWSESLAAAKDEILAAFGVPESVLGNASGRCLRASEKVILASGEVKKAEELVGQTFTLLQPTYDSGLVEVKASASYALKEPIYKITTFSGRTIETNGNHPLFMAESASKGQFKRDIFPWGWTSVEKIKSHFDKNDIHGTGLFTELAVPILFEQTEAVEGDYDVAWEAGELGQTVPDYLFTADAPTQSAFLSGLYSKHGLFSQHTSFDLYVPSKAYAEKLQLLLQRLNVHAIVNTKKLRHIVSIAGKINMFVFLSQIELAGENANKAKTVWQRLSTETSREHNSFRSDGLPNGLIWDRIYNVEKLGEDQTVALTVSGDHTYLSLFWEHNTFNNAETEEEQFWTKTMVPHCDAIARELEALTDSEDRYVAFDYTSVDILQRIERRKQDALKQDFARGIVTGNQVLAAMGLPEVNNPYMKVYFHPSRLVAGEFEDVKAVAMMPVIGSTTQSGPGFHNPYLPAGPTGGDGKVGESNDLIQGELAANLTGEANQTINDQAARTLRRAQTVGIASSAANPNAIVEVRERIDRLRNRKSYTVTQLDTHVDPNRELKVALQSYIEGNLESWSNRQLEIVKDRVNHVKVRKGTRHWEGEVGTKSLDVDYIVDTDSWVAESNNGLVDRAVQLISEKIILGDTQKNLSNKELISIVEQSTRQFKKAVLSQTNLLKKHISVLDNDNKSISEIQDTLTSDAFDRNQWIIQLSKVVTNHIVEATLNSVYSNIDGEVYKIWCSGTKEHYRAGHGPNHGTKKNITEPFIINGVKLQYPTDGFNSESVGCDCWIYYGVDK